MRWVPKVWRHWCGVSAPAGACPGSSSVSGRVAGPPGADLPRGDQGPEFLIDRYQCLAFHLVAEIAQVRCPVRVEHDAIAIQPQTIVYLQAAVDQDQRRQPQLPLLQPEAPRPQ